MSNTKIIFYDFETTGLNVYCEEPIELAAIDQDGNTYSELFKPFNKDISLHITNLTGITNDMVKDKDYFKDSYNTFLDFIGPSKIIYFVAHNQEFDKLFLKKYLGSNFDKNWKFIDSIHFAKLVWPYKKSYKLSNLARSAEIEVLQEHRALDDVKTMIELFKILSSRFNDSDDYKLFIAKIWKSVNFI